VCLGSGVSQRRRCSRSRAMPLQCAYNYVTPKSFLELIAFYRFLLGQKREASGKLISRLDEGLAKLKQTAEDVAELKIDVQRAMGKAEDEVKNTDALVACHEQAARRGRD